MNVQLETLQLTKSQKIKSPKQTVTPLQKQLENTSNVSSDEQIQLLLLLQSLRWRITNLIKHNDKRSIVIEYIKNDIFQLKCNNENKVISNLLTHSNRQIIETSLRLLNVISSYLS